MGQKKLVRFAELETFPNVLQYPQGMAGTWSGYFKNNNPITVELACGKGEYTVGLASMYPRRNFIGIDVKGNRIWVGAKKSINTNLTNAAFIRSQIEMIDQYFTPGEVQEIWIPFPDPQLRNSKAKKRLTHPRFLRLYKKVLKNDGCIHLKTDSPDLYQFTKLVTEICDCKILIDSENANLEIKSAELDIRTHYESLDIASSKKIHYLKFTLPENIPVDADKKIKEIAEQKQVEL